MHRFDEQFMLREAYRKMQVNTSRAAVDSALRELKRSRPSLKRRLARSLVTLAERLEPGSHPAPRKPTRA